jgi:type I restriction enzyme, R subunit
VDKKTKQSLSEQDISSKFILPALQNAGWDNMTQIREQYTLTKGPILVRGKVHTRGQGYRPDFLLSYIPNQPIAVIEAKDNNHSIGDGMQQALRYADYLQVPSGVYFSSD